MKSIKETVNWLKGRWRAKTPKLYNRIIWWANCIAYVAGGVMAGLAADPNAHLKSWYVDSYPWVLGICLSVICFSKFQKENKKENE